MKYMGSKSRIAKYIVPIIQSYVDKYPVYRYYEPFVGGCNVIDKIVCREKLGSDINKYLIALLKHIQQGGELYDSVPRELYNAARDEYKKKRELNKFQDWQIGNIGFLASYNGKFFDGGYAKPGYEKTKTGLRYRDYYQESNRNLLSQAKDFDGIDFLVADYRNMNPHRCVIYADPLYNKTTQYDFCKDYQSDEFWKIMEKWAHDNIVIVSELHAPEQWKIVWSGAVNRSLNVKNKYSDTEKLFMLNPTT